jgi:methyl-accepting chemotaxis protein
MLDHIKLRTRITLLVVVALLGLLLNIFISASNVKRDLMEARQGQVRVIIEAAKQVAADYHAQVGAGALTDSEARARAAATIRAMRYGGGDGKSEYLYVLARDGMMVMHPVRPEWNGQNHIDLKDGAGNFMVRDILKVAGSAGLGFVDSFYPRPGSDVPVRKLQYVAAFEPWSWVIGTGIYVDDVDAEFRQRLIVELSIGAVLLLVIIGVAFLVGRSVLRQVGGEPAEAIMLMDRVAAGDLTVEMQNAHPGSLLHGLSKMLRSLREMVAEVATGAAELKGTSERIAHASNEVAQASHRQADSTSSMAAAIEEMTVAINHISESARDTEANSSAAAALAESGEVKVTHATDEMQRIAGSAAGVSDTIRDLERRVGEISSIAGVIKEIAAQTNLLALNAAIEAARAGEQGRGFAVVADEVRGLAERTATATVQIEQMISSIQGETATAVNAMEHALPLVQNGVALAQEAAQSLRDIRQGAGSTLERIREVALATSEQSAASNAIAQQVESIAQMVEETSAAMQHTAVSASELEQIADQLKGLVGRFRY